MNLALHPSVLRHLADLPAPRASALAHWFSAFPLETQEILLEKAFGAGPGEKFVAVSFAEATAIIGEVGAAA